MKKYFDQAITFAKANQKPLLAALALVAIVVLIWGVNQRKPATPPALKLAWKDGEVLFSGNGAIWEFADAGTSLVSGSSLKTSEGAKAMLQTPDGSFVRLGNSTEIKVESVTGSSTLLTQNSGRSFHRVKKADSTLYQVNALGNAIQSTGTAFDLSVNPKEKRINLKVLEGQVALILANNETAGAQKIDKGNEVTTDAQRTIAASLAAACPNYIKTDWFQWNKTEDLKLGYELKCDVGDIYPTSTDVTAPSAKPAPAKPAPAKTTSTTSTKTTQTFTAGSCKPSLSLKRGLGGMGIQLNWTTCKNDDFQYYKVVRSTTNSNLTYPSTPALVTSSNRFFGSYLDKNIAIGQTYYYRVCALERLSQIGCGNVAKMTN